MGAAHITPDVVIDGANSNATLVNALHPHMVNPTGGILDTFNYRMCSTEDGAAEICRYDPTSSADASWESLRTRMPDSADERMILAQTIQAKGVTRQVRRPVFLPTLYPVSGDLVTHDPVKSDAFVPITGYAKWL